MTTEQYAATERMAALVSEVRETILYTHTGFELGAL